MEHHVNKPAAEVIIVRPNGNEDRIVRTQGRDQSDSQVNAAEFHDEDYRLVSECAPYTASFNNLLRESRPNENAYNFVMLIHDRMHAEGIPMVTQTYNLLMKRMVRYSNGVIFSLYEEIKAEGVKANASVRPDVETFRLLFRACERGAQYNRAFLLYQQMRDLFNLVPDTSTYNTLLGYCAAARDVAQATYLVNEMKENGVEMDVNTFNCLMSSLVDSAPYSETLRVFHELKGYDIVPTNRTYNTVLKAACIHDDYDRVFQLFEEMKKRGLIPDVFTYNTLLSVCERRLDYVMARGRYASMHRTRDQIVQGKLALAELALTLLSEMEAICVVPNTYSYNRVLAVLLECEDVRIFLVYQQVLHGYNVLAEAEERKQQMLKKKKKLKISMHPEESDQPNGNVHAVAADGDGVAAAAPEVEQSTDEEVRATLEEAMRSEDPQECGGINAAGVNPNIETYMLMMKACQRLGYAPKCQVLYKHMTNKNIHIDRNMAMLVLRICEETLNKAWSLEMMAEAKARRLLIDSALYNRFMGVLAALGDEELLTNFEEMKLGINEFGAKADTETYNIVMKGYLQLNKLEEALALYDDMNSLFSKVTPNDDTYCLMIDVCRLQKNIERPTAAIEQCIKSKMLLALRVFHHLYRLYCDLQAPQIETLFARMKVCGQEVIPLADVECYTIVMEYYLKKKRYEEIGILFDEIKTSHTLEANASTYDVLFSMYRERENRRAIVALFDDARINSVKLKVTTYNIIITAFLGTGDPFVFDVLTDMKSNCITPADSTIAILMGSSDGRRILSEAVAQHMLYRANVNCGF